MGQARADSDPSRKNLADAGLRECIGTSGQSDPSSDLFRHGAGLCPRHRKTTMKASPIYRQRSSKAASSMGITDHTAISVFRRLFPPMPDDRCESATTGVA